VTYYEELGISPAASVEEIREAYKQIARLLHPDTLRDERSRIVAECQMKRLNSVYETLTHAEQRRIYDLSIGACRADVVMVKGWRWEWCVKKLRGPDGAWIGAGFIVMLAMLWAMAGNPAEAPAARIIEPAVGEKRAVLPSRDAGKASRPNEQLEAYALQLRRQVDQLSAERNAAVAQIGALERRVAEAEARASPAVDGQAIAAPQVAEAAVAPRMWRTPAKNDFAGTWYYEVPRDSGVGRGLYPPEYIEAVIREESGYLIGRYRARYRVADRSISPEVVFQFSGKGGAGGARLPWIGIGGARGEVTLKLVTQDTLEIAWIASELGQRLGLGSGTARLARRHEP
jgi:curved DNA-binding protein CbpA